MTFNYKLIGLASIAVIFIAIYLREYHRVYLLDMASGFPFSTSIVHKIYAITGLVPSSQDVPRSQSKESDVLFTSEELKHYDSSGTKGKLYLSILGQIFDVTKGKEHYGEGGGYSFFTGRDASRAFVTGDFTETGLSDDILNLSPQQFRGLKQWLEFYNKEYKYVGKLNGRYYDYQGHKTPYLIQVESIIQEAEMKERERKVDQLKYPPCNTEWSASKGGRVWCSKQSGGVSRDWIGVPRKLFVIGSTTPRCACIRHPNESQSEESALDDPKLELYPGCHKDAISCSVKS